MVVEADYYVKLFLGQGVTEVISTIQYFLDSRLRGNDREVCHSGARLSF